MPLRAILDNESFYAEILTEENRKQTFLCPNCPSELIPVIPQKEIIKHFRHKNGEAHGEHETEEHENGKNKLRDIAVSLGFNAITEYRIGDHITDVFVESPIPLAIEFQCSKCNSEEIIDRNITYAEHGITSLWILGNNFLGNEQQTKIEENIINNQDLFYYDGSKFKVRHKQNDAISECYIQAYISGLAKGKKTVDIGKLCFRKKIYVAGKMAWFDIGPKSWLSPLNNLPYKLITPEDVQDINHNTENPEVVNRDIEAVDETNATIAVFIDEIQVGTITELLHAIKRSKPVLAIFVFPLVRYTNNCGMEQFTGKLESDIQFMTHPIGLSAYSCQSKDYWFLIDYLLGWYSHATVAIVKTNKDIPNAISSWILQNQVKIDG
jgi:hypothetical protein